MARENCGGKDKYWHEAGGMRDSTLHRVLREGAPGRWHLKGEQEDEEEPALMNIWGKVSRQKDERVERP